MHEFKIYQGETTQDLITKIFIRLKIRKSESTMEEVKH